MSSLVLLFLLRNWNIKKNTSNIFSSVQSTLFLIFIFLAVSFFTTGPQWTVFHLYSFYFFLLFILEFYRLFFNLYTHTKRKVYFIESVFKMSKRLLEILKGWSFGIWGNMLFLHKKEGNSTHPTLAIILAFKKNYKFFKANGYVHEPQNLEILASSQKQISNITSKATFTWNPQ